MNYRARSPTVTQLLSQARYRVANRHPAAVAVSICPWHTRWGWPRQMSRRKPFIISGIPCTASRIRRSAWPPGFSTITMRTANRPRRSPLLSSGPRALPANSRVTSPRQHHALLADEHGSLCASPVLGVQGRLLQHEGCLHPRGRDRLSERAISGAANLDRATQGRSAGLASA